MNLRSAQSAMWSVLPAALYHPREGGNTTGGMRLSLRPGRDAADNIQYAAFSDIRFYHRHLYRKLIPFLPEDFEVVGEPTGQNCFMHCLDIHPPQKEFGRRAFDAQMEARGFTCLPYKEHEPRKGDIIAYAIDGYIDSIRQHVGLYVGEGRVRSRWGYGSPLIEHPLERVVPTYWNRDPEYLSIERPREGITSGSLSSASSQGRE